MYKIVHCTRSLSWAWLITRTCALNRERDCRMTAEGSREDLLAEGILGILAPAVEHVDQKIVEVR